MLMLTSLLAPGSNVLFLKPMLDSSYHLEKSPPQFHLKNYEESQNFSHAEVMSFSLTQHLSLK